jgi:phosphoglycolate phosphatase-like HAD superfamily hydrolase
MDGVRPHGKTDPAIIREVFTVRKSAGKVSASFGEILDAYLTFLPEEVNRSNYKVLPGIAQLLSELKARRDLAVGLATGNVEQGARIKLDRGGLNPYFGFGGFGSDSESRMEMVRLAAEKGARHAGQAIAARDTFVIGDTPRDIEAGREAGFRTVGVATSDYSQQQLEASGADLVISDLESGRDQFLRMARIV